VELLDTPGRRWLYSGGGYSVLQLMVEELTGRPFAEFMQTEVLGPLGMTASSFQWHRTAATACPHDADGGQIPDFAFVEQAAAGLVTTAADLAGFVAAALPGPEGEPPGRGVLRRAGVRMALTAAPAPTAAGGLATLLACCPTVTGSPTTRAPTAAGGPVWCCCPAGAWVSWCWPTATPAAPHQRRGAAVGEAQHEIVMTPVRSASTGPQMARSVAVAGEMAVGNQVGTR
jgi:CubicO group peptidase (beta-lactamase class C family)